MYNPKKKKKSKNFSKTIHRLSNNRVLKQPVYFFTEKLCQHSFFIKPYSSLPKQNIWGFGNNNKSQVCSGDDRLRSPQNVSSLNCFKSIQHESITKIITAYQYSFFLTKEGSVFVIGSNEDYGTGITQLEGGSIIRNVQKIIALAHLKIIDIAVGERHSLFLDSLGNVMGAGKNSKYQLGVGHNSKVARGPVRIAVKRIRTLNASKNASLFLDVDGTVFECGQVLESDSNWPIIKVPQKIAEIKKIRMRDLGCGSEHQFFICSVGNLYARGKNNDNRCGEIGDFKTVTLVKSMKGKDVVRVCAGFYHSLFLCRNKDVYGAGDGVDGQIPGYDEDSWSVKANKVLENVEYMWCGSYQTFIYIKGKGIQSCGYNTFGSLGDGTDVSKKKLVTVVKESDLKLFNDDIVHSLQQKMLEIREKMKLYNIVVVCQ